MAADGRLADPEFAGRRRHAAKAGSGFEGDEASDGRITSLRHNVMLYLFENFSSYSGGVFVRRML
jgi:hypothetical protein